MRTLADFEGRWALKRHIEDRKTGVPVTLIGGAQIEQEPHGARYLEKGLLTIGETKVEAVRVYHWRTDENGEISVYFEDGRFFHRIGHGDHPRASHPCSPDLYEGAYDFSLWPEWRLTWHVSGPRKDYTSITVFRPEAA